MLERNEFVLEHMDVTCTLRQPDALACCTNIPVPMVVVVVITIPSTAAMATVANFLVLFITYFILEI